MSEYYAWKKIRQNLEKGHYKSAHCENCLGGDCGECSWNEENRDD